MRLPITPMMLLALIPGLATGADPTPDPGTDVRGVFAARCVGCHGPDLPKPKGRFGYVLDLKRVAGNPEFVIPSRPDESELWVLVQKGEMPPADSPQGPLTSAEKETIRAWIAAGAPDSSPGAAAGTGPSDGSGTPAAGEPQHLSPALRTVRWVGKFHLLLLHFPIALMMAAAFGDLVSLWRGVRRPVPAVQFCLSLAAVAVVPTVALGWIHAATGNGVGSPQLLAAHRWLGTAAGLCVTIAALRARHDARCGACGPRVRVALVVVAVSLVGATAHVGGWMVHGRDFFEW